MNLLVLYKWRRRASYIVWVVLGEAEGHRAITTSESEPNIYNVHSSIGTQVGYYLWVDIQIDVKINHQRFYVRI